MPTNESVVGSAIVDTDSVGVISTTSALGITGVFTNFKSKTINLFQTIAVISSKIITQTPILNFVPFAINRLYQIIIKYAKMSQ